MDKNKLTEESPRTAWVHAMMKISASNDFHDTLTSKWTSWTNSKGILSNIGLGGRYDGGPFSNFIIEEIKQCLGLLILNGLSISSRDE